MQLKRWRRIVRKTVRKQQKQAAEFSQSAEQSIDRNVFRRLKRLKPVRRFIIGWIALFVLIAGCLIAQFQYLSAFYQEIAPVPGGIYTEGMVGSISNTNPIYATSDVDRSLSRLLHAGLLGFNDQGVLVGNLASKYESSEAGKVYTVTLKPGLRWHDGRPLTAKDVVFTFNTIKNPNARSPLQASWRNVTVASTNEQTVTFTLSSPLAAFPYGLTTGIIPEHVLGTVSADNLRSHRFNTIAPVGAGPFRWHGLQVEGNDRSNIEERVALTPFENYVSGQPKLNEFIVRSFASKERLQEVFASGQLTAAAGLTAASNDVPDNTLENSLRLKAGNYVFFKTTVGVLANTKVRQALVASSNPAAIMQELQYGTRAVTGPLLQGQIGYNKQYDQKTNNLAEARSLLSGDGWVAGQDGVLQKGAQKLSFTVTAVDSSEYRTVLTTLAEQWSQVGAQAKLNFVSESDYSAIMANHDYEATLYGITIGDDPDVYAYWDGSQADVRAVNRLNLSEWNNAEANLALSAGRTRLEGELRAVKYAPLLQAWQQDAPALGLYQPRYVYLTRGEVYGLTERPITSSINRYNGVENWQIRTARVTQQ